MLEERLKNLGIPERIEKFDKYFVADVRSRRIKEKVIYPTMAVVTLLASVSFIFYYSYSEFNARFDKFGLSRTYFFDGIDTSPRLDTRPLVSRLENFNRTVSLSRQTLVQKFDLLLNGISRAENKSALEGADFVDRALASAKNSTVSLKTNLDNFNRSVVETTGAGVDQLKLAAGAAGKTLPELYNRSVKTLVLLSQSLGDNWSAAGSNINEGKKGLTKKINEIRQAVAGVKIYKEK